MLDGFLTVILTNRDIDEFERAYLAVVERDPYSSKCLARFFSWLANNPQVFVAAGFQEFVVRTSCPYIKRS